MIKRIVIADDHAFVAQGMTAVFGSIPNIEIAGIASNGIEAIALVKKHQPDCAILDLGMPGANGLEAFIEAKRWSPATKFAIVTGSATSALFRELVDAGIDGIFLKNAPIDQICDGILRILEGNKIFADEVMKAIETSPQGAKLTARELEVLQNIARGKSNREIAEALNISPKTIDNHRANLMRKMDTHSTATLLVRAMRDGLLDI